MRQGIEQHGAEVGKGVFDWQAYEALSGTVPNSKELRVGYKLHTIEIFNDRTLEVVLSATDSNNSFDIFLTDYAYPLGTSSTDASSYNDSSFIGSGNVSFSNLTGDSGTSIRLNTTSSYTGTTFISGSTNLVLSNSWALGSTDRHTTFLSATEDGATLTLTPDSTANVGGLLISDGAQIDFGGGRRAVYGPEEMVSIDLAYVTTIHKSQGSEYRSC
jgi:hypothetical protein